MTFCCLSIRVVPVEGQHVAARLLVSTLSRRSLTYMNAFYRAVRAKALKGEEDGIVWLEFPLNSFVLFKFVKCLMWSCVCLGPKRSLCITPPVA